ncbi:hypothetical protein [Sodalis sp. RH16]|uniref:hypothetical protein n=1 Tax=unclassified Sodalis (in: enterobacteria) TaxID=2636512 RepID=UPI0039B5BCB7
MANYAEIQNGVVINVCVWDGVTPFDAGDDIPPILIPENSQAWIGWGYTAPGGFAAPPIEIIE